MKNGDVNQFIDEATFQEVAVKYNGKGYFFYGLIWSRNTKKYTFNIDVWDENREFISDIFTDSFDTEEECMAKFFDAPIFDGKKFWEAEKDMEWVETGEVWHKGENVMDDPDIARWLT